MRLELDMVRRGVDRRCIGKQNRIENRILAGEKVEKLRLSFSLRCTVSYGGLD